MNAALSNDRNDEQQHSHPEVSVLSCAHLSQASVQTPCLAEGACSDVAVLASTMSRAPGRAKVGFKKSGGDLFDVREMDVLLEHIHLTER